MSSMLIFSDLDVTNRQSRAVDISWRRLKFVTTTEEEEERMTGSPSYRETKNILKKKTKVMI